MNREGKNIFVLFVLSLVGYFMRFAVNVYLARHVSEALFGDFNLAMKILVVFVGITIFGSNITTNRYLSKFLKTNDVENASKYISWNYKLLSVTFFIAFAVATTAFLVMILLHHLGFKNINEYHMIVYTLWLFPFLAINQMLSSYLVSSDQVEISAFINGIFKYITRFFLFLLVIFFIDPLLQQTSIIFVVFLAYVIVALVSTWAMNSDLLNLIKPKLKKLKNATIQEREWLVTSKRLTLNSVIYALVSSLDLLILEVVSKSEADVGFYAASLSVTTILWIFSKGMYSRLEPYISILVSEKNDLLVLQKRLNTTNFLVFLVVMITSFVIFLFKKKILLIFGPTYINAEWVLSILCLYNIIGFTDFISSSLLGMGGFEKVLLHTTIAKLFMLILILPLFTYFYGMIGTALGMLSFAIIKLIINIYLCRVKLDVRLLGFI